MASLSEIEKLEARWAENPDGRYFAPLADAYRKAGRVDDALMVVAQGLIKHPDYLSAYIVLGRCHLEKKDDAAALATFEKVLGLDTENIIALKSLAEIAERQTRNDDARRWLTRLLAVDAMNTEAADDLARLGGPIEGEAPAAEVAEAGISFADLAPEPAAPAAAAAAPDAASDPEMDPALLKLANQQTLHVPRASIAPLAALGLEPTSQARQSTASRAATEKMPALELEPTSFQPPPDLKTPDIGVEPVEGFKPPPPIRPSTELAAPIEFLSDAPAPAPGRMSWSGAPEVADVDLNKAPAGGGPRLTLGMGGGDKEIDLDAALEEPAAVGRPLPAPASDLPLIMPEDVTPAEEMRRPSGKQVRMISPEPAVSEPGEPMVTETVGDLYLRQGFKDKAADVYRRLLTAKPDDIGLRGKLAALESPAEALSAAAQGTEAVGAWLRRIARASLPGARSAPAPAAPIAPSIPVEPPPDVRSPMDQAFSAEPEPVRKPSPPPPAASSAPAPTGAPARPASDAFTLDQVFGGRSSRTSGEVVAPEKPAGAPSSFDEFFGAGQPAPAAPEAGGTGQPTEQELSAFNTWLHGLKR